MKHNKDVIKRPIPQIGFSEEQAEELREAFAKAFQVPKSLIVMNSSDWNEARKEESEYNKYIKKY